jgi:predicted  nucleic acid-binding Zn-ribbon protein
VSDNAIYDIEKDNLETHVTLCAERYRRLEDKFDVLEARLDNVASEIASLKNKQAEDMNEIKKLIQGSSDIRFKGMVAASGTIIAALISALAYILTKHA